MGLTHNTVSRPSWLLVYSFVTALRDYGCYCIDYSRNCVGIYGAVAPMLQDQGMTSILIERCNQMPRAKGHDPPIFLMRNSPFTANTSNMEIQNSTQNRHVTHTCCHRTNQGAVLFGNSSALVFRFVKIIVTCGTWHKKTHQNRTWQICSTATQKVFNLHCTRIHQGGGGWTSLCFYNHDRKPDEPPQIGWGGREGKGGGEGGAVSFTTHVHPHWNSPLPHMLFFSFMKVNSAPRISLQYYPFSWSWPRA